MMSRKYYDFFVANAGNYHVFLQGGRRSRKTWSTFEWLECLCEVMSKRCKRRMKVIVLCYSFNHIQATANDFEKCLKATTQGKPKFGYTKGAYWEFKYCDDPTKALGTECDFLFVNEASAFAEREQDDNILVAYSTSVRCQTYYNFNPTHKFAYMERHLVNNKQNLLCTTWRDNPYLTDAQKAEFELMKVNALKPNASVYDIKNYKVFYLGEFDQSVGAVFHDVTICKPSEYTEVPAMEVLAVDFGFATSGDPTTCVGVKIHNNKIYVRQYIYERGLTSNAELIKKFEQNGFTKETMILGDYGGMGKGRMVDLKNSGWMMANAPKTKIADGLSQMNTYDEIVITSNSIETIGEFRAYRVTTNNKLQGDDHAIDASRYAFTYAKKIVEYYK